MVEDPFKPSHTCVAQLTSFTPRDPSDPSDTWVMEVVLSGLITKEKDHLQIAFAKKAIPSLSSFSNTVYRKLQSLEPGVSQAQPAALHWEMILNNLLWLVKAFLLIAIGIYSQGRVPEHSGPAHEGGMLHRENGRICLLHLAARPLSRVDSPPMPQPLCLHRHRHFKPKVLLSKRFCQLSSSAGGLPVEFFVVFLSPCYCNCAAFVLSSLFCCCPIICFIHRWSPPTECLSAVPGLNLSHTFPELYW